jgi:hypothetical protein
VIRTTGPPERRYRSQGRRTAHACANDCSRLLAALSSAFQLTLASDDERKRRQRLLVFDGCGTRVRRPRLRRLTRQNVRARPDVAIVIHHVFDGELDAVYIKAIAVELNNEADVGRAAWTSWRAGPRNEKWQVEHQISIVTGGHGPWRICTATRYATEVRREFGESDRRVVGHEPADLFSAAGAAEARFLCCVITLATGDMPGDIGVSDR